LSIDEIVNPTKFKDVFSRIATQFSGDGQEDAHEFLRFVVLFYCSEMHEAVKDEEEGILYCFNWRIANRVVCTGCGHESETVFSHRELSLPFPAASANFELVDLIKEYFVDEKVDYGCEECGCLSAEKKVRVLGVPRVLLFHLNRFGVVGGRGEYVKRRDNVGVPEVLEIVDTERNGEENQPRVDVAMKSGVDTTPHKY
jgi:ubiquitin C-terminal hydrolase